MGILNRTLDASQQKELIEATFLAAATGKDLIVHKAPCAQVITDAKSTCVGLSGAPTSTLKLQRFVVGAGLTTISISGALTHTAIGTSGSQTYSLPAAGSSLLVLAAGDFLVATTGGTNAGTEQSVVHLVVQNVPDIKPWF